MQPETLPDNHKLEAGTRLPRMPMPRRTFARAILGDLPLIASRQFLGQNSRCGATGMYRNTRHGRVGQDSARYRLKRIEMHYFASDTRLESMIRDRADFYLAVQRALRLVPGVA